MPDTGVQQEVPFSDLGDMAETGLMPTTGFVDAIGTQPIAITAADFQSQLAQVYAQAGEVLSPSQLTLYQEAVNPLGDAVNDGIVPPSQARDFFYWLLGNQDIADIPVVNTYAFVEGYVVKWAQQNGWATYGPNPLPTPIVTQPPQSINAPPPLPGAANPPAVLPTPSVGQSTTARGAREIVPTTINPPGIDTGTAQAIQAAVGVATADMLKLQAAITDTMLPNMAPGQVPEALTQLNTAVNALENQMGQVRSGKWPRGFVGLQEAVGGALQALNGLSQEVGILAQQMATKADSGLEDAITAIKHEADGTAATVATVVGTTVPFLEGELGSLTGQVNGLVDTVDNEIKPELSTVTQEAAANTDKLSGTDKDCLDQLCDAEGNVINPITEGGATPSLLRKLGGLLGGLFAAEGIMALVTTIETLLNAPAVYSAVAQDMPTMATWAEQAANVIASDLSWSGPLNAGG